MPTGVEEAGLVMAAFPLLICLIDEYKHGVDLIRKWLRYQKSLKSIRRGLAAERQVFENACYRLFDAVLGKQQDIIRKLFSGQTAQLWSDQDIDNQFQTKLGKETWEVFQGALAEILDLLGRLLAELQKNVPIVRGSPLALQLSAFWARFTFVFSHKEASMQDLRLHISRFQSLVDGVSIRRSERLKLDLPAHFRTMRQTACEVCVALDQSFRCACSQPHTAALGLRSTSEQFLTSDSTSTSASETTALEMMFRLQNGWTRAAVKPRSHPAPTLCNKIGDLCSQLQQRGPVPHANHCLGFVSADPCNQLSCYCLGVVANDQSRDRLVSLYQLLAPDPGNSSHQFYERDRLELAIILSTSLLQLHSTPWLQELWTSKDILFKLSSNNADPSLQPYVSQTFPGPQTSCSQSRPLMVRNVALYALGKVLLQLIENRLLIPGSPTGPTAVAMGTDPEQQFAFALEPTVYRKAGQTWSDVVRRCLHCDFDIATEKAVFDNDDFVCRVYSGVIQPLVQALARLGDPL